MNPDAPQGDFRREWLAPAAILMAAAFALFANTFGHAWTYDDFPVIVENADILSIRAFFKNTYPDRPLRELTYMVDHAVFGMNPAGWHLQNIFWHGLNAGLLFALVRRMGGTRPVAWIASILFLVHPLQVEVVANISHRKDSLALAFSLVAVLAYAESFDPLRRRLAWVMGAFGLAWVACLAKQNAVVIPAVFVAYELSFVPKDRRFLLKYRNLFPAMLAGMTIGGAAWAWSSGKLAAFLLEIGSKLAYKANYFAPATPEVYFRMVLKSWTWMFSKFFLPVDLALEYTYPVPSSWLDPWVVAALLGVCFLGAALWYSFRRQPLVFFALAWVGAFWLPVSNIWPLAYFAADRYLYAPSAGVFILVALGFSSLIRRPLPLGAAVLTVAVVLAGMTWRQNKVWRNPETLWTQAYKVSPESSFTLNNLGNIHLLRGELLNASEYYAESAKVNSMNSTAHYNLGLIYERIGNNTLALEHYRRFLALDEPAYRSAATALRRRLAQKYGNRFR